MTDTTNAGPVLPLAPELRVKLRNSGYLTWIQARECDQNIRADIEAYGLQCWNACDEQVAGPLRERVAELEAQNSELDRLRAEVEALRSGLTECADDLEAEVSARASGELPRRIERDLEPVRKARALLAQPAGSWVNPLAAEVEKLRAKIDRAEVSYGNMLRADDKRPTGTTDYTRGWGDCLRAIAARKGEGSEE